MSEPRANTKPVTGRVFLTGATGFVGGNILEALGDRPVRALVRDTRQAARIAAPNVQLVAGDVTRPETLRGAMDGCEAVVHLVAVIADEGDATFDNVIRQGTVNVAAEAKRAGLGRFVHMSALGTRNDPRYAYLEAKWQAEQAVEQSGIPWTIFRPSIMFGPGDGFISMLAKLIESAPVVPVVGAGRSLFQPLSVREVARAFVRALDDPKTAYEIYELGGSRVYSYEELLDVVARVLGKQKPRVHLPVGLMQAAVALSQPLPKSLRPPVTSEQLKMLDIDNATDRSATAELIGAPPLPLEEGIDYIVDRKG
jgi:NADH dehydrogenase